jgi:hypothetical protein
MNCQDVARIVDTGSFSQLSDPHRRDAEAHARSCPHCAPAWAAHARLAGLQIPPLPAELVTRVRTLAALPPSVRGGYGVRRLTLVGGFAALAAAAGLLMVLRESPPEPLPAPGAIAPAPVPSTPPAVAALASQAVEEPAPARSVSSTSRKPVTAQPGELPLIPLPVNSNRPDIDPILQKMVERYPELVEGPEIVDGIFVVAMTMRANGTVVDSTLRLATRATQRNVAAELDRLVPSDGGNRLMGTRDRSAPLPDGRTLRADLVMRVATVPDDYDPARSNVRIDALIREKYAHLMRPAAGGELNRLTIFLSEDDRILREQVEEPMRRPQNGTALLGSDRNDVLRLATRITERLGLTIEQVGLIGAFGLEEGSLVAIKDATGGFRTDDQRRVLVVEYAWPRREGESGPRWGQGGRAAQAPSVDPAAALTIVEATIPDAFTVKERAAGEPTLVFTASGEFIRAGRVRPKPDQPSFMTLREQLMPDMEPATSFSTVRVTNKAGVTADVIFAWKPPADKPSN